MRHLACTAATVLLTSLFAVGNPPRLLRAVVNSQVSPNPINSIVLTRAVLRRFTMMGVPAASSNPASLTAREWPRLLREAKHGNKKAQLRVAFQFKKGEVVKQDFTQALKWFSEAAKQGEPIAEGNLGLMYYLGQGVDRNPTAAAQWFERAASQGLPEAQFD